MFREHIGPGSKPYKKLCLICNTQRDTTKIEKHVKYCLKYYQHVHKDGENSEKFSCKLCSKSFDLIGSLYNHLENTNHKDLNPLREHIGPGSKYHRKLCHICNTEREGKKIEKHVEYCLKYFQFVQMDDENPRKCSCKLCQKNFDHIGSLYNHIETNHDGDLNPLRYIH